MKKLRFLPILGMLICISFSSTAQTTHFFYDFSNDYTNWTTYSVSGDDQWHLSGEDGIDGGTCARIYTNSPPQANDDWVISPAFKPDNISKIRITFDCWYCGGNLTPEFYYSTNHTGDFG